MISHKIKNGWVGVNVNHDKSLVLVQLTDDDGQTRIALTPREAVRLARSLLKHSESVRDGKFANLKT